MSKVLVTGGSGFIGAHLVRRLVAEGAQVVVLDDGTTGDFGRLREVEYQRVVGSVADPIFVSRCMVGVEVVFHLAARNIIESIQYPAEDCDTNVRGTLNVLMAGRDRRVVYASSASVYGNARRLPACEDDECYLLTPYAASKYAGEGYCQAFYESYRTQVTVLRYSNVYGPGQGEGVIPRFMSRARRGEPLRIHGDGSQTRDFTHVDDVVVATLLAARSERAVGEVFNIGTGVETSVNELADLVSEGMGQEREYVPRRDVDGIKRRAVNIEKARRVLRWEPKVSLRVGLGAGMGWGDYETA